MSFDKYIYIPISTYTIHMIGVQFHFLKMCRTCWRSIQDFDIIVAWDLLRKKSFQFRDWKWNNLLLAMVKIIVIIIMPQTNCTQIAVLFYFFFLVGNAFRGSCSLSHVWLIALFGRGRIIISRVSNSWFIYLSLFHRFFI